MRIKRHGSVTHPVTIDEAFLDRLEALLSNIRDMQYEKLALIKNLTVSALKEIENTPPEACQDPDSPKYSSQDDIEAIFAAHGALREERRKYRAVQEDVTKMNNTTFDVSLDSGFRASSSQIDQLRELLKNEPGRVDELGVSLGQMYEGEGLRIRFSNQDRTASYDIAGERKDVDASVAAINALIASSAPDHPILHRSWFHFSGAIITCVVALGSILSLIGIKFQDVGDKHQFIARYILSFPLAILPASYLSGLAGKVFPPFQVEFGDDFRRQKARRARLGFAFIVILIPIAINVVF